MVYGRLFSDRMVALQRQGRMGTFGPLTGQEASLVGLAASLRAEDWLMGSYREILAYYVKGVPPQAVMASLKFSRASCSVFPCETHPGSAGHSATIHPSSASVMVTWKIILWGSYISGRRAILSQVLVSPRHRLDHGLDEASLLLPELHRQRRGLLWSDCGMIPGDGAVPAAGG